jgi:hypothetical protein
MTDLSKVFKGEHPLFSEPAHWVAAGHGLWSNQGENLNRVPLEGRVRIIHEEGKIINRGEMSFVSKIDPIQFSTTYELTPTGDNLVMEFFQEHEEVGDLRGKVVFFDDRLVTNYTSGDGHLHGSEVFAKMGDNRYTVTGSLTHDGELLNLWKMDLVRPKSKAGPEEGSEEKSD